MVEMWSRNIQPSISFVTHAVRLCCDAGLSRMALGLAQRYEAHSVSGTSAPSAIWTRILRSSADTFYVCPHAISGGLLVSFQRRG